MVCAGHGPGYRPLVVVVVEELATEEPRTAARELHDDGSLGLPCSLECCVGAVRPNDVDGGQRAFRLPAICEQFIELRAGNDIEIPDERTVDLDATNFFDDRAKSEFLEQCVEGSMVPDVTVFNTAWLIERDLSEFYGKMAEQTTGTAHEALSMLSAWEKEHERFFREYRDKLSEVYANMPWGG